MAEQGSPPSEHTIRPPFPRGPFSLILLLALGIVVAGGVFFRHETARTRKATEDHLSSIADLKAVRGASVYRDNALHWTARAYLKFVPPYCAAPRAGDAAPASACAARAALAADFPASGYVVQTDGYLSTAGCTCP